MLTWMATRNALVHSAVYWLTLMAMHSAVDKALATRLASLDAQNVVVSILANHHPVIAVWTLQAMLSAQAMVLAALRFPRHRMAKWKSAETLFAAVEWAPLSVRVHCIKTMAKLNLILMFAVHVALKAHSSRSVALAQLKWMVREQMVQAIVHSL